MFKCTELIYLQLQKTASSHIIRLLTQLFDGNIIGKHNKPTLKQIQTTPYLISSIRNPWDWYVSLWSFGVQKKGSLMHRLTQRNLLTLSKQLLKHPTQNHRHYIHALTKNVQQWRNIYTTSTDTKAFRCWLAMLHDPKNRYALGEGYANTMLPKTHGFMTHRYLYLCCHHNSQLTSSATPMNNQQLLTFDKTHCYVDYFIRQENLEQTLFDAIEKIRPLSTAEKTRIMHTAKTNTSNRPIPLTDYYDQSSIELIQKREQLIIEKFGYVAPK